ncbi:hypothetical protein EGW08_004585 [Elysia chlorotica]|uniref:C-type lectin domain-containing protein n=1 Tax=Elysia chlorotica TaxID=188477 RepID=A0A3S1A0M4_ELYCH|nr:hypothetical protein EGW08_004585 [Elysia chlorotica]
MCRPYFIVYISLVIFKISLANGRRFCPPQYRRLGSYCFTLTERTTMLVDGYENDLCWKLDGTPFSVRTWKDQRAAEQFLEDSAEYEPVWLRGYVGPMEFRKASNRFVMANDFNPKVSNFLHPDQVNLNGPRCIVMVPVVDYKWVKASCTDERHKAICFKALRTRTCFKPDCIKSTHAPSRKGSKLMKQIIL